MGCSKSTQLKAWLNIFVASWLSFVTAQPEVLTATACYGVNGCNTYSLKCSQGSVIKVTSLQYGYKGYACNKNKNRCFRSNRNGCCVYKGDDCFEDFSSFHAYSVLKECSGKRTCGPLQAPFNILTNCNGKTSTYVHIKYECVQVSETTLKFCDAPAEMSAPEINIQFDPSNTSSASPISCSCFVSSSSGVYAVTYNDVRLVGPSTGNGATCSSATLSSLPADDIGSLSCDGNPDLARSTFYHLVSVPSATLTKYTLSDVYRKGTSDEPEFVWLSVIDADGDDVTVQCFIEDPSAATSPITPSNTPGPTTGPATGPTTGPFSNSTEAASVIAEKTNTGAIVAGVLVPIIILVIIGVVVFFIWRRKRNGLGKSGSARPNQYVDTEPEVYDEIPADYISNIRNGSVNQTYNKGYLPRNDATDAPEHSEEASNNVPTYQNVKIGPDRPVAKRSEPHQSQHIKPVKMIMDQTDRIIAFFRKTKTADSDLQPPERGRENSGASYDHINAMSSAPITAKQPIEGQGHIYSHTHAFDDSKPIDQEPSAIQVGDAYIEFKFDVADDDVVVQNNPEKKPEIPNRPPPFPNSSPRPSPSGSRLSPIHTSTHNAPSYDYAAESPRGSASDISGHSYKVLEKQANPTDLPLYDYADVDDKEQGDIGPDVGGERLSLYEDVELRPQSVRRQGTLSSEDGYLAPFATMERTRSAPDMNNKPTDTTQAPKQSGKPNFLNMNEEIMNKKLKPVKMKKGNDTHLDMYVNTNESES